MYRKYLKVLILLCHFFKKDFMGLKIKYYRTKGVTIGKNMRAFSPLESAEPYLLEFGNDITVSSGVKFTTHDNFVIKLFDDATDIFGRIKIGNNCFIGQNTVILPGVEIGDNTIIGAGSIVTKSFNGNIVIGGNPAKEICNIEEYKKKISSEILNTRGMTIKDKHKYLIKNKEKFLKK